MDCLFHQGEVWPILAVVCTRFEITGLYTILDTVLNCAFCPAKQLNKLYKGNRLWDILLF